MAAVLHGSARTTPRIRAELQRSKESTRALAARCQLNPKTVAKWRARQTTGDAAMGLRDPRSTVLSPAEEAIIVEFPTTTVTTTALQIVLSSATTGKPGFNTPDFHFPPVTPGGNSIAAQYIRLYDNVSAGGTYTTNLDGLLNNAIYNMQVSFHGVCGGSVSPLDDYGSSSSGTTVTASFACPSSGATWTLLLGTNPGTLTANESMAISSYSSIPQSVSPSLA